MLEVARGLLAAVKALKAQRQLSFHGVILFAQAYTAMIAEKLSSVEGEKGHAGAHVKHPVQSRPASYFCMSASTVTKSIQWVHEVSAAKHHDGMEFAEEFWSHSDIRGLCKKHTRVPEKAEVEVKVRQVLVDMRKNPQHVTGHQEMEFFVEKGYLDVPQVTLVG